ncbi:hypothetical protein WEN_01820 [Mycoplasma wenyonii str. Massachusetts]|uniref:Uncharacterized protein n=1 Tax=Mycoplasma wenyonii (strain Massachusetts) TaxID=1197325 RepID=I6ZEX6_MYCWM|nr:hypothetical protein WEN_01820 [Mycoplasma wenyonii str. Massachusetts]
MSKREEPLWVKENEKNKWKDVKFDIEEQNINRVKYVEVSGGGTYVVNNCKFDEINIRDRGLSDKNGEHKAEEIKLETIVCKGWIFSKKLLKALN